MEPPVRPPRLRCGLFPSMYLPHLLVLPATFGLQRFQPPYPYFPALYVVSVRQVRGLPTASSRFHLTMDTLALGYSLPATGRLRDFHPLEYAPAGRSGRRLTIGSPADLPQNRAYRSGTRLLPCLRTNRFVIRTERPESRLLKPCV